MRRVVRLKEFTPSSTFVNRPQDSYLAGRDPVLEPVDYVIHTDENGFIISSLTRPILGSSLIVLGDSFVEGMFVHEHERFCARLEAHLLRDCGLSINVLNAGYSGATLLHSYNVFLNKIAPLRPTAVLLMSGFVDTDVGKLQKSYWSHDCWLEPIVDLDASNAARDLNARATPDYSDRWRLLKLLRATAQIFDIPLAIATLPHRTQFACEYTRRAGVSEGDFVRDLTLRRTVNAQSRAFALEEGVPLLDLEWNLQGQDNLFYDAFHPHSGAGIAIAEALSRLGLVDFLQPHLSP